LGEGRGHDIQSVRLVGRVAEVRMTLRRATDSPNIQLFLVEESGEWRVAGIKG